MFDLPASFPDGSIGAAIAEVDDGFVVVVFRTPELMVAHAAGETLRDKDDFATAYASPSLIDCIHYIHSVNLFGIHHALWGF